MENSKMGFGAIIWDNSELGYITIGYFKYRKDADLIVKLFGNISSIRNQTQGFSVEANFNKIEKIYISTEEYIKKHKSPTYKYD